MTKRENPPVGVPAGRVLRLPGRGRTWIREIPGPPGAPTLFLLHGLGASGGLNWAGSFAALAGRYRVVAIDHRGHGRGIRTRHFRLEDCADDVAAVVEEMGLEHVFLVGYSMGGPIASLAWERHRDLFDGIVFCATSRNFRGKPGERVAFAALAAVGLAPWTVPGAALRAWLSVLSLLPFPGYEPEHAKWGLDELGGHDVRSIIQAAGELGRFDARRWLPDIDIPVAVVATTNDRMVSPSRQARLAMAVPTAVIHPVAAGHLSAGLHPNDGFNQALVDACREVVERAERHPRRRTLVENQAALAEVLSHPA